MPLIRLYWNFVFRLIRWLAFKHPDQRWAYLLVLGLVQKDLCHIGGSWDSGHVFDISPVDVDPDDLFD